MERQHVKRTTGAAIGAHRFHPIRVGEDEPAEQNARITIGSAILSVMTAKAVNRRVAMTGEITLRGDVLPIGGLKEKVLAAKMAGIHTVIVPRLNRRDLADIPKTITDGLTFHFVDHMDEVLKIALIDPFEQTETPAAVPNEQPQTASV